MVETAFSTETIHTVTEANFNYYATPFVHPRRNMSEHDFIYMLQGEWEIGQNDEVFSLEKDSLLILSAGQTHFGASACTPGTNRTWTIDEYFFNLFPHYYDRETNTYAISEECSAFDLPKGHYKVIVRFSSNNLAEFHGAQCEFDIS